MRALALGARDGANYIQFTSSLLLLLTLVILILQTFLYFKIIREVFNSDIKS